MGKRATLSAEQRAQIVLRLLSKEEPAVQIARRAGRSEQTLYRWREEFLSAGKQALSGRGALSKQGKTIERLRSQLAERDQVIGEITIANRVLKKTLGRLGLSEAVRAMIVDERKASKPPARLSRLLEWLGVACSSGDACGKKSVRDKSRFNTLAPISLSPYCTLCLHRPLDDDVVMSCDFVFAHADP